MKTVPTTNPETLKPKSPAFYTHVPSFLSTSLGPEDKALLSAEKTSGAPLPNASKVTPAKD
jgi:hypothetical protein